jgi:hypothetical protein
MSLTPREREVLPAAIIDLAEQDPGKWLEAARSHARQLSGAPPQLPPLSRQAWNFLQALWKHLRNGMPQTPARLRKARLKTCKACPHFLPENERCGVCGCFLATKISWQLATCPKGKW